MKLEPGTFDEESEFTFLVKENSESGKVLVNFSQHVNQNTLVEKTFYFDTNATKIYYEIQIDSQQLTCLILTDWQKHNGFYFYHTQSVGMENGYID